MVVAPAPPAISSVIVAEAEKTKNGILESGESLKVTWAATSSVGIGSQSVQVDGMTIRSVSGPYGGMYYSCPIGKYATGSHSYTITSTDSNGASSTSSGTFTVAAPAPPTICQRRGGGSAAVLFKDGVLDVGEPLKITWAASSRERHRLTRHDRRRPCHHVDQRSLRRAVLLLPDRKVVGRHAFLHDHVDRLEGRFGDVRRHVPGGE